MKSLENLRTHAAEHFGPRVTPVQILWCWVAAPDSVLTSAFRGTGLSCAQIAKVLTPMLADPPTPHRPISIKAHLLGGEQPLGLHLLAALTELPGEPMPSALEEAGLSLATLSENLMVPAPTSYLSEVPFSHGRELTAAARMGEFDALAPRPEVEALVDVLLRWRKGHPVLVGPAGVGKTALVELLARKIANSDVPQALWGARIFELRIGSLVAGTRFRGEFEARLENAINQVKREEKAILFIDELHLIKGAGKAEGSADAAELLKPILGRSEVRLIGATTTEEYQQHIAPDGALARRLTPIRVSSPGASLCAQMVRHQAQSMSKHHGVTIPSAVLGKAIGLTDRYITDRHQPDKAVDLLDRAAVKARRAGDHEVTEAALVTTLALWTGLEEEVLRGEQGSSGLEEQLRRRIHGQDESLGRLVAALAPRLLDLGPVDRPRGAMLLTGPTGVGKTQTAQTLAEALFGAHHILRLDLSEFTDRMRINTLLGASPGYQGGDRDGILPMFLEEKGAGVVLLDELEKAHPDVIQAFIGVLDHGELRSGRGRRFDARPFLFIATTNAVRKERPAGFTEHKDPLHAKLSEHFPPELLGRMDAVIAFTSLAPNALRLIALRELEQIRERLSARGVTVEWDRERVLDDLMRDLVAPSTGARAVIHAVEQRILGPLASRVLAGEMHVVVEVERRR